MKTTKETMLEKLHPKNNQEFSPKMHYIISKLVGERWCVNPHDITAGFSIVQPNSVVAGSAFIGALSDFNTNIRAYILNAGLNEEEQELFYNMMNKRVWDFRPPHYQGATLEQIERGA